MAAFSVHQFLHGGKKGEKTSDPQGGEVPDAGQLVSEKEDEDVDAESEPSLSEEDARGKPSFAKAATRNSPVRVAPAASLA